MIAALMPNRVAEEHWQGDRDDGEFAKERQKPEPHSILSEERDPDPGKE